MFSIFICHDFDICTCYSFQYRVNTSSSKKRPAYAPKSGSCEKLIGKVRDGPPRRQQLHAISQPCKNIKKTRNPAITSRGGKKEESSIKKSSEAHRKKLVRRSVHVIRQKDKGFPRTPNKSPVKRIMRTKTPSGILKSVTWKLLVLFKIFSSCS